MGANLFLRVKIQRILYAVLFEGAEVKAKPLLALAISILLFASGCANNEYRVYPAKLSDVQADEAMGKLSRSTSYEEVTSKELPFKTEKASSPVITEKTLPLRISVIEGKKYVTIDLRDFLSLVQANDNTFLAYKEALASAEESLRDMLRSYRPVFGGSISSNYNLKNDTESQGLNFSLSQTLPWKGSLAVNNSANRNHSTSPPDVESTSLTSLLSLSFDIYLRPGGFAEWRENLIQGERNWVYAQRSFRKNRESYVINMVQEYYNTLNANKSVESQRERYQKAHDALEIAKFEYERGRRTLTEVNIAEESLLDAEQGIIDAQNEYDDFLDDMKLKLGIPQEYGLILEEEPIEVKPISEIDIDEAIKVALANNVDYQTQRDRYEDRRRNFILSLYALRTVPHLTFSYNLPLVDEKSNGGENTNSDWTAAIAWTYNLDQEGRKNQYRSLLQSWSIYERDYKRTQENNIKSIRQQIRQLLNARRTLSTQERSYQTAMRKKEGADLEYETGKIDSREMTNAIIRLQEAQDSLNRARVSYKVAYLKYLSLLGRLTIDEEGEWLK